MEGDMPNHAHTTQHSGGIRRQRRRVLQDIEVAGDEPKSVGYVRREMSARQSFSSRDSVIADELFRELWKQSVTGGQRSLHAQTDEKGATIASRNRHPAAKESPLPSQRRSWLGGLW